jgi:hypothetical protein
MQYSFAAISGWFRKGHYDSRLERNVDKIICDTFPKALVHPIGRYNQPNDFLIFNKDGSIQHEMDLLATIGKHTYFIEVKPKTANWKDELTQKQLSKLIAYQRPEPFADDGTYGSPYYHSCLLIVDRKGFGYSFTIETHSDYIDDCLILPYGISDMIKIGFHKHWLDTFNLKVLPKTFTFAKWLNHLNIGTKLKLFS